MRISQDDLLQRVEDLIMGRRTVEVEIEFMGRLTILGWRFHGEAADSQPLEVEELWQFSGSSC